MCTDLQEFRFWAYFLQRQLFIVSSLHVSHDCQMICSSHIWFQWIFTLFWFFPVFILLWSGSKIHTIQGNNKIIHYVRTSIHHKKLQCTTKVIFFMRRILSLTGLRACVLLLVTPLSPRCDWRDVSLNNAVVGGYFAHFLIRGFVISLSARDG